MTNFQKAFCVILSICFLGVLAVFWSGPVLARKEGTIPERLFGQIPLYRFLEDQAKSRYQEGDWETYERIGEKNGAYLAQKALEENEEKLLAENQAGQTKGEEEHEGQDKEEIQENEPGNEEGTADAEKEDTEAAKTASAAAVPNPKIDLSPQALADYDYLFNNFFILDPNTATSAEQLNAANLLGKDMTMETDSSVVQILIYHSHSQEAFADSDPSDPEDTIVGVGNYLAELLTDTYGYNVMHITEEFDVINGQIDRDAAYDMAREYVEPILEENPSIQVVIDLHRDGVPEDRRLVTEVNGKPTAQLMFFNGLSYTVSNGTVDYLPNPYIQDNLSFSFQMEYEAAKYYPDLYRGIYLAGLRYNLHLRPRAVLLEAGAQTNTVQEVKNAMEPFADILHRVLSGDTE